MKVYCKDCRHSCIGSFGCAGEDIYLHTGRCKHPTKIKKIETSMEPKVVYGKCEIINKKNNCRLFEPSEYRITEAGYVIKRNPNKRGQMIIAFISIGILLAVGLIGLLYAFWRMFN